MSSLDELIKKQNQKTESLETDLIKENQKLKVENEEMKALIKQGKIFAETFKQLAGKGGLADGNIMLKIPKILANINQHPTLSDDIEKFISKIESYELT